MRKQKNMPRAVVTKQYRDFTGGLNTDASPLNMPENTVTDILDMIIEKSGRISRARFSDEDDNLSTGTLNSVNYIAQSIGDPQHRIDTFVWKSPNGDGEAQFAVVRTGSTLNFYDLDILSNDVDVSVGFIASISLAGGVVTSAALFDENPIQFTSGQGLLFLAGRYLEPTFIEYDGATTFTTNFKGSITTRDFTGVDDSLDVGDDAADYSGDQFLYLSAVTGTYSVAETVTEGGNSGTVVSYDATNKILRLTTTDNWTVGGTATGGTSSATGTIETFTPVMADYIASSKNNRLYNLYNQGWTPENITKYTVDQGIEPDNTKVWTLGKDSNDVFDPSLLDKQFFGTTAAPKGRILLDIFTRDRQDSFLSKGFNTLTVGGTATVDTTADALERPTTVTFAFGRVWWSGANNDINSNKVWFSQILREDGKFSSKAYQDQDPTSEILNTLLDTDGGELVLTDAGTIKKLVPFKRGVLALGTTGIWYITGADAGFTPSSLNISKIGSQGVLSAASVVETPDAVFYWSPTGIQVIVLNQDGFSLVISNITEGRINDFYLNNGPTSVTGGGSTLAYSPKFKVKGVYDEVNNRILWGYSATLSSSASYINDDFMSHALIYNLDLNCFYRITLPAGTNISTVGFINKEGFGLKLLKADVSEITTDLKFYQLEGSSFTGAGHIDTFFETLGDTSRTKNMLWVVNHFERTEDGFELNGTGGVILSNQSSCLLKSKWDWTDTDDANRWSSQNQVYRLRRIFIPTDETTPFDYGFTVITTRNKIRGHGKAVQFRFDTEGSKDLIMLGWDVVYEGNGTL